MTEMERKLIMKQADMIKGEINRMCVTNELSELNNMHVCAVKNLDALYIMIYDARFKYKAEREAVE